MAVVTTVTTGGAASSKQSAASGIKCRWMTGEFLLHCCLERLAAHTGSHQFAVKKQVATCTNAESPLAKDGFGTMRHCIRGIGTPFTLAWFYMYNNTDSGH